MFSEAFYKNTTNLTRFIFFWDPDLLILLLVCKLFDSSYKPMRNLHFIIVI